MSNPDLDPFALGGAEDEALRVLSERDGDAVIFDLFREWQAQMRDIPRGDGDDELTKTLDHLIAIEDQLCVAVPSGAPGLAIKIFVRTRIDLGGDRTPADACAIHALTENDYGAGGRLYQEVQHLRGLLLDAMRFVPELAPLVAPIVDAPLVLPGGPTEPDHTALRERVAAIVAEFDVPLPEGDAGIFEAARRLSEIQGRFRVLSKDFEITCEIEAAEICPHRDPIEDPLLDHLEKDAEPKTLAAAAVMLRHAFESGVVIDPRAGMVKNVLALVEREGGAA